MQDEEILALFFARSQQAITLCREQYGGYCRRIAEQILGSVEDAAEVENDVYLATWQSIPPKKPLPLLPYLGALTRSKAIDRRRAETAQKRGGDQYALTLEELEGCLSGEDDRELPDRLALQEALDRFLDSLSKKERVPFMRRYWWCDSVKEIAAARGVSEGAVKTSLARTRTKLKAFLEKEGFDL